MPAGNVGTTSASLAPSRRDSDPKSLDMSGAALPAYGSPDPISNGGARMTREPSVTNERAQSSNMTGAITQSDFWSSAGRDPLTLSFYRAAVVDANATENR